MIGRRGMCDHSTPAEPVRYELRVEGQLGPEWSAWFAGLVVTPDADGTTRLTGPVIDQAALYGLLRRVRDLGLPLLAVNRVPSVGQATAHDINEGVDDERE